MVSLRARIRQMSQLPPPHRFRAAARTLALNMVALCLLWPAVLQAAAQAAPPASKQAPENVPSTAQAFSSYEGQNVTAIEVAGRPESTSSQFASLFVQQAGQPFSTDKVDRTAAALKAACKCEAVRVQVEAEANGVRVLFVLEPAVYFGIFQFPGAGRFPYSRLVQVANYPTQTPFVATDVEQDR